MQTNHSRSYVRCWYYDVAELCDVRAFKAAMDALPWQERRAKVNRFVFLKDRCLCLGAGLLCAYALRAAGARDLAIGYGDYDKPYLQKHPDIHFNLSHAGTVAVCAVSGAPVGVDVEVLHAYDDGVARLCFTDEERLWARRQGDTSRAFTRLWTRKESYLKLLGTGLSKAANSFVAMPGTCPEPGVHFSEHVLKTSLACICTRLPASDVHVPKEVRSMGEMIVEGQCLGVSQQ